MDLITARQHVASVVDPQLFCEGRDPTSFVSCPAPVAVTDAFAQPF